MPWYFFIYFWSVIQPQPVYRQYPTRPPVYWQQTMPVQQSDVVIVMPPCRVLGPTLSVCS